MKNWEGPRVAKVQLSETAYDNDYWQGSWGCPGQNKHHHHHNGGDNPLPTESPDPSGDAY